MAGRQSLLSSQARIQVPWVKVTIGDYTFGVFDKKTGEKDSSGNYTSYNVQYPSYIKSLNIVKINGQVNQYTLQLEYPIRFGDDPNKIEKILSSVSNSRKIIFSYGDASVPSYAYKEEVAIITKVNQSFNIEGSTITYTISAVSGAVLAASGAFTFINSTPKKPSDEIKRIFRANSTYGLQSLFTGMSESNLDALVDSTDQTVQLDSKINISPIDYINYLVGCMIPAGAPLDSRTSDIYIFTLHDEHVLDSSFGTSASLGGPYFKVTRTSTATEAYSDAYEIDVGYNTSTIVLSFSIENQENFAMLYDYNKKLTTEEYVERLNSKGEWETVYAPRFTSGNTELQTRSEDRVWFTKLTKYPISATITIQGLLRPANLMQYVRLNVIFPGGNKHISSGLYIVTKQADQLDASGYRTTLSLTRLAD